MGPLRLLLCCVLLFSAFSAHADAIPPLKVVSLNFNSEDVPNDYKNILRDARFTAMVHWVHENDPDVILLQEAWNYRGDPSVALTLAKALDYDVAYRLGEGFPLILWDSDAVLTKRSLHMRDQVDLKLPHSAPELGDGKTWVVPLGRVSWAVGVTVQLSDGSPVYVYSTHLLGAAAQSRYDQIRAIDQDARQRAVRDGIRWHDARVIVSGDFNTVPTDPGAVFLSNAGYVDTFDYVHPGDPSCTICDHPDQPYFNPITIGAGLFPVQDKEVTDHRIDYIFSRGPGMQPTTSYLAFSMPYDGIWMSDHFGVVATFGGSATASQIAQTHDHEDDLPPTRLLTIKKSDFPFPTEDAPVPAPLQFDADRFRGITIQNRAKAAFSVEVAGPGEIFTNPRVHLSNNTDASFNFEKPGDYTLSITHEGRTSPLYGSRITGIIHVH